MATAVIMPRQGNSVESCIITAWKKQPGDTVKKGDILALVETDKAVIEVESPAVGVLLAQFFPAGADVPVLTNIAAVGSSGEDVSALRSSRTDSAPKLISSSSNIPTDYTKSMKNPAPVNSNRVFISPRARTLAENRGIRLDVITGTGPEGRIIERDIRTALSTMPPMTRQAQSIAVRSDILPANGSGIGGRMTAADFNRNTLAVDEEITVISVRGIRKITAERMVASLQTTAQLTMNTSADARALHTYRQRLKASDTLPGLRDITINDLLLFAVVRILPDYADLNAHFQGETITQYKNVHIGFAVDTPRGLLVPVIRYANRLSLKQLSTEAKRLAEAAISGRIMSDEMSGGTVTVSNLGSFGIESFTPVLNPPQVAILGVGSINLKPVDVNGSVEFIPHIALSLTIDHQAVDGAPAARFLQALVRGIAAIDLLLAV